MWQIKCLVLEVSILAASGSAWYLDQSLHFWKWTIFTSVCLAVMVGIAGFFGELMIYHMMFSLLVGAYLYGFVGMPIAVVGVLAWLVVLFALWRGARKSEPRKSQINPGTSPD